LILLSSNADPFSRVSVIVTPLSVVVSEVRAPRPSDSKSNVACARALDGAKAIAPRRAIAATGKWSLIVRGPFGTSW